MLQPAVTPQRKNARLRELLAQPGIIRSFGAHDVFTALLVERAGFETVFIGGFGTSASLLGLPDLNFLTLTEMADAVRRMARRLTVPLIADGDTGHGDVHNVVRTVAEFEAAGASGIILEDQVVPKRCGHFEGKQVIPAEEMVLKLKAAQRARADTNFVIIARTDAREVYGLDEAIRRANLYGDAGADVVFIEAPLSVPELETIARQVPYPKFVNMLTGGKTPVLTAKELEQLGYKIVVYPIDTLLVTAKAVMELAQTLQEAGTTLAMRDRMVSFDELKALLGVDAWMHLRDSLDDDRKG
ncbi:2,3-dimethylmalate lyase [bacterium HR17]|jgi:methylisocitrate lyase|uniref:2,3-dimethylmalate lyase n=1 Tax=Candidatus Fervidibacter japonicus TaxID=2035412 RepID=A0A2H5X987_9BACT|nr:2,3-dimethylmalate lyase [bacterium HR17]